MGNSELSKEERAVLESMIDTSDVSAVLRALALVCVEKSEHLQVNWQDKAAARRWDSAHKALMRFSETEAIFEVSHA